MLQLRNSNFYRYVHTWSDVSSLEDKYAKELSISLSTSESSFCTFSFDDPGVAAEFCTFVLDKFFTSFVAV